MSPVLYGSSKSGCEGLVNDQGEEPAKKVKKEEPDELFQDQKGQEIRNFVLNIVRNAPNHQKFMKYQYCVFPVSLELGELHYRLSIGCWSLVLPK